MNKTGVRIKIAVNKIDEDRLFKGKNTYLDATVFIDKDNPGQYGDHGFITQDIKKEERDSGMKAPIIGNVEVFWEEGQQPAPQQSTKQLSVAQAGGFDNFDETPPF